MSAESSKQVSPRCGRSGIEEPRIPEPAEPDTFVLAFVFIVCFIATGILLFNVSIALGYIALGYIVPAIVARHERAIPPNVGLALLMQAATVQVIGLTVLAIYTARAKKRLPWFLWSLAFALLFPAPFLCWIVVMT